MKLKSSRMETLVDGIFAIIMTIMVVSLSEIFSFANPVKNIDFYKFLSTLSEDFIAYILSFLILGILWFEHHWQFHFIKYIDPVLVFINILWLMFLCLIPFSTMLLGNHPSFFAPVLLFELNILIVFSLLYIHWGYAIHKGRLVEITLNKKSSLKHMGTCLFPIMITLCAIILSFLSNFLKK
ncbi:MAG: TMEM175 family protein [Candidatus Omnitrophica bacterium]|nr:TMEM175 family protein [Candidatus Omnitrophota bacterium]